MRLHDEPLGRCQCGATTRRGQLPFVGFHQACGSLKTPKSKVSCSSSACVRLSDLRRPQNLFLLSVCNRRCSNLGARVIAIRVAHFLFSDPRLDETLRMEADLVVLSRRTDIYPMVRRAISCSAGTIEPGKWLAPDTRSLFKDLTRTGRAMQISDKAAS